MTLEVYIEGMLWRIQRPVSVYRFPRRALTLCPQLCIYVSVLHFKSNDQNPTVDPPLWAFNSAPAFLRGALTLCPRFCMGISLSDTPRSACCVLSCDYIIRVFAIRIYDND